MANVDEATANSVNPVAETPAIRTVTLGSFFPPGFELCSVEQARAVSKPPRLLLKKKIEINAVEEIAALGKGRKTGKIQKWTDMADNYNNDRFGSR